VSACARTLAGSLGLALAAGGFAACGNVDGRRTLTERVDRPVHVTVAATGDFLIHQPVWTRARADGGGRRYDFRPMLRFVRPIVRRADVALCHVETPLTPRAPSGYPRFSTPRGLARAIRWAGYDVCSTASNHSLDRGQYGIGTTGRTLHRAGLAHTGSFASAAAQRRSTIITVKGVKVAFLAYTEMTNGIPLPHRWSVNIARARRILRDARRARRRGAQAVVVNLHWGTEYQARPSRFQRWLAERLTRDGTVTAVVGQHVHVVQPIKRVNGRLVVFGEGNLVSNQTAACCPAASQDGLIALLRITVGSDGAKVSAIDYVPTWVRHPDYAILPVGVGLRRRLAPARVLRASRHRTVRVAGRRRGVRPRS
jgi:poly-gamma-glutamate capsule biosynthesis protein CapA/YwtB (metallophosphatase superfamily)